MKRNGLTAGALAWAGLIFVLSSLPGSRLEEPQSWVESIPGFQYFVHGALYFVLGLLVYGVLRANWPGRGWLSAPDTVIFCLIYGMGDEFHQQFVDGRSATGLDLIADVLGATVAVTLLLIVTRLRSKSTENGNEP